MVIDWQSSVNCAGAIKWPALLDHDRRLRIRRRACGRAAARRSDPENPRTNRMVATATAAMVPSVAMSYFTVMPRNSLPFGLDADTKLFQPLLPRQDERTWLQRAVFGAARARALLFLFEQGRQRRFAEPECLDLDLALGRSTAAAGAGGGGPRHELRRQAEARARRRVVDRPPPRPRPARPWRRRRAPCVLRRSAFRFPCRCGVSETP